MGERTASDTPATEARRPEAPVASRGRLRWGRADSVKAFVLTALFVLMVVSAVRSETDLLPGVVLATFWTALLAIVWELAVRALAQIRRSPDTTR
jgi:hypothetical protein